MQFPTLDIFEIISLLFLGLLWIKQGSTNAQNNFFFESRNFNEIFIGAQTTETRPVGGLQFTLGGVVGQGM